MFNKLMYRQFVLSKQTCSSLFRKVVVQILFRKKVMLQRFREI